MESTKMFTFRKGNLKDKQSIKSLAITEWSQFQAFLSPENWDNFEKSLKDDKMFIDLLEKSNCILCENEDNDIIGFAFLISSGNPTGIYNSEQAYIRFVTVSSDFSGNKIGQRLTEKCMNFAIKNGERHLALHTSEMMEKARHIYEKLGFKILRELEPRMGKRYWLYELALK
jgi:ribosomal protein S18 acetylase RimI-like enzyme